MSETEPRREAAPARLADWSLRLLIAAALAFMLVLSFFDVIGRYFLNAPIPGAFEFTEIAMGLLVFAALPLLCAREQHITIDLLAGLFRGRVAQVRDAFVNAFSALVVGGLAWRLLEQANRYAEAGNVSVLLNLPLAPFSYVMFGFSVLTCAVLLWRSGLHLAGRVPPGGAGATGF